MNIKGIKIEFMGREKMPKGIHHCGYVERGDVERWQEIDEKILDNYRYIKRLRVYADGYVINNIGGEVGILQIP